jgi:uncharacterized RDD family membrane protein YckC
MDQPWATRYAHPVRRVIAYLVDGLIVGALVFLVVTVMTVLFGPTVRFDDSSTNGLIVDRARAITNAVVGVLVGALYFVGSWIRTGRTVGAAVFDLRVVAVDGTRRLSVAEAVIRWIAIGAPFALLSPIVRGSATLVSSLTLATIVWSVVLLVTTIVDRRHRGIHDRLARSIVIRGPAPERHRQADTAI